MTSSPSPTVHVFSHMGPPPYRYLGMFEKTYQAHHTAPVQAAGICDHCGTCIRECFQFRAADGRTFVVGNTCVEKSGDKGLRRVIAADVRKHNREVREARQDRTIAAGLAALPAVEAALAAIPHPDARFAARGETQLSRVQWMMSHAGRAGKEATAKYILKMAGGR